MEQGESHVFCENVACADSTRTVNLNKMAYAIPSGAEQASRYRRLQRFFAEFIIDEEW